MHIRKWDRAAISHSQTESPTKSAAKSVPERRCNVSLGKCSVRREISDFGCRCRFGYAQALKFLVPVARQSLEDCQRMAAIFSQHHSETLEAVSCMALDARARRRSANVAGTARRYRRARTSWDWRSRWVQHVR